MAQYEMYATLNDGRKRLVSTFNAETDEVTMVHNAQPVTMQRLHTSQQPKAKPKPQPAICAKCHSVQCHCGQEPKPPLAAKAARPPVIRTMREAKAAVLAALMEGVPEPPSFDRVLEAQKQLGLR